MVARNLRNTISQLIGGRSHSLFRCSLGRSHNTVELSGNREDPSLFEYAGGRSEPVTVLELIQQTTN